MVKVKPDAVFSARFGWLANEVWKQYKQKGEDIEVFAMKHFGLSESGFRNWLHGRHVTRDYERVAQLGELYGWTVQETYDYFQKGVKAQPRLGELDLRSLDQAPIAFVLQTLEVCLFRLKLELAHPTLAATAVNLSTSNTEGVPMANLERLRSLIQEEQARKQKTNAEFAEALGIGEAFLTAFLNGEPVLFDDLIISAIADGVPNESGDYRDWRYIARLVGFELEAETETEKDDCRSNGAHQL